MRNRRRMILGILAVLLIGSLVVVGCGSKEEPEPQRRVSYADLVDVCFDNGVPESVAYTQTSGTHPIAYAHEANGRWRADGGAFLAPVDWRRSTPQLNEVELVACIKVERTEIERCPYTLTNGEKATVSRAQSRVVVTLREAQTAKVIATSKTMTGEVPPECQDSEQFPSGTTFKTVAGSSPVAAIHAWLKQYVEIP